MKNYHLTNKDGEWKFRKENSQRSIKNFDTKTDALNFTKDFMNNNGGSLKIHKTDGTLQEERTYPKSKDPRKTKG
jgi:hypothetical protein